MNTREEQGTVEPEKKPRENINVEVAERGVTGFRLLRNKSTTETRMWRRFRGSESNV